MARRVVAELCAELDAAFGPLRWREPGRNYGAPRPYAAGAYAGAGIPVSAEAFEKLAACLATIAWRNGLSVQAAEPDRGVWCASALGPEWELVLESNTFAFVGARRAPRRAAG